MLLFDSTHHEYSYVNHHQSNATGAGNQKIMLVVPCHKLPTVTNKRVLITKIFIIH